MKTNELVVDCDDFTIKALLRRIVASVQVVHVKRHWVTQSISLLGEASNQILSYKSLIDTKKQLQWPVETSPKNRYGNGNKINETSLSWSRHVAPPSKFQTNCSLAFFFFHFSSLFWLISSHSASNSSYSVSGKEISALSNQSLICEQRREISRWMPAAPHHADSNETMTVLPCQFRLRTHHREPK
jgi:hypothetical protein